MIPLQIKLRNFLSYGATTQTIDFQPHRLICLSGKNGHGKSALLDAVTWALWGRARKTSATAKADEGLIRLGQTHMLVAFDFLCNGKQYRVQREFVINHQRSHTELHFGLVDEKGLCTGLSEKTLRGTQQKIIDTLGLDYDSCINSIFLRQGQSNEFSSKSAKERKEILSTILGINRYELLRAQALEKSREHTSAQEHLRPLMEHLTTAVAQKPLLTAQLEQATETHKKLELRHTAITTQEKEMVLHQQKLIERQQKGVILQEQHAHALDSFEKKRTALQTVRTQLRALRAQQRMIEQCISSDEQKKIWAEEELLSEKARTLFVRKEEFLALHLTQTDLANRLTVRYHEELARHTAHLQKQEFACSTVEQHLKHLQNVIAEQEKQINMITREAASSEHTPESAATALAAAEKKFERKKQFYHTFIARGNSIAHALKEVEQKLLLGETVTTVTCPLCEQALSSSRKKFLQEKFSERHALLAHQKQRLARIVPALKSWLVEEHARLQTLHKQLAQLKERSEQQQRATKELSELNTQLQKLAKEAQEASCALTKARQEHLLFQQQRDNFFANDSEYATTTQRLSGLQKEIAEVTYDEERHNTIKKIISLLHQQNQASEAHRQQLIEQEQSKAHIASLCVEMRALKLQIIQTTKELATSFGVKDEIRTIATTLMSITQELHTNRTLTNEVLQKKGALEQQIKTLSEREIELAGYDTKLAQHAASQEDFTTIAQALSKNGIQALLIETALPELEHEANMILGKLTDNQAHIIIESVRDLKSGGYKETLDIKISDAVGTRQYELFSGGEAFRIDFALRIALSKLLARRSGTSLQTLIIDEGFGSQDEEGLARIMEALYKIQDDFAKIIIVSHLPEMKNQFPTHFFVHKNASGSQVTVFEQG